MTGLLAGRTVVVTGGSSGNGRAIALAAGEHGAAAVVVADLRPEPREGGTPTVEELARRSGTRATFVRCDVRRAADVEAAVAAAEELGGVDVMVNNAGVVGPSAGVLDYAEADFDDVVAVNLKGTFLGCRAAARRMAASGGGAIVNVGSVAGRMGSRSSAVYSASKAAVELLTATIAGELGPHGIRVNAVVPGIVRTQMSEGDRSLTSGALGARLAELVPVGRPGEPEEVAGAVTYLASDLARYVNGAALVVDGGLTSRLPS